MKSRLRELISVMKSRLSVESGYISDNRQSKLSLHSRGSLSNCLVDEGETDQVNQSRVSSSNTKPLNSISERYQPPSPLSSDPSSPANSTTSSSSLASFLSTSPCSSRRSSVSYSSFRKPRGSLSRTPSTRSRDCTSALHLVSHC